MIHRLVIKTEISIPLLKIMPGRTCRASKALANGDIQDTAAGDSRIGYICKSIDKKLEQISFNNLLEYRFVNGFVCCIFVNDLIQWDILNDLTCWNIYLE